MVDFIKFFAVISLAIVLNRIIVLRVNGKQILITGHPFSDNERTAVHGHEKRSEERVAITFPGTRWCGPGNTAGGYDDLGKYEETDKCCRDHDHCENIAAGEEKYGLRNDDWFTRLHCDCDRSFYTCLHSVNQSEANLIGRQYFLFRDRCFKEAYPIVECVEYQSRIFIRRCIKYRLDASQDKIYQWFDLPLYDIEEYPDMNGNDAAYYQQINMDLSSNSINDKNDVD